jgi:hypothetical protein
MLADKSFGKPFNALDFERKRIDKVRVKKLIANKISEANKVE